VTECWAIIRAEDCYTALLHSCRKDATPGLRASLNWVIGGRGLSADCEVRPNKIWRIGRLFLICPRCHKRCTRLYLPLEASWLACRRCWGLTYNSRTLSNYKDTLWGRGAFAKVFGTSQRDWAYEATSERRKTRSEAARVRAAGRRRLVR
jgi:hypothetical protein